MFLVQRLIVCSLSLLCLIWAGRFMHLNPVNHVSIMILGPALLASLGLLLSWRRPVEAIRNMFLPRIQATHQELKRSQLQLQTFWRHLWQVVVLLMVISVISIVTHLNDLNALGHSIAVLLDACLFLLLTKGLLFLPAEIQLNRRLQRQPAVD